MKVKVYVGVLRNGGSVQIVAAASENGALAQIADLIERAGQDLDETLEDFDHDPEQYLTRADKVRRVLRDLSPEVVARVEEFGVEVADA